MSASKGKQQKSLLSFFSPPPRAATANTGSANGSASDATKKTKDASSSGAKPNKTKGNESNGLTSSSAKKNKAAATVKSPDATRKRIDFSPKPTRAKPEVTSSMPEKPKQPQVAKKRKEYEDFLGTSSEEDDDKQKSDSKTTATGTRLKRLRKSAIKVVDDDDDEDEEEDEEQDQDKDEDGDVSMGTKPRRAAATKKTRNHVVSSDDEDDPTDGGGDASESDASVDDEEDEDDDGDDDDDDDDDDEEEEEEEEEDEPPAKKAKRSNVVTPAKQQRKQPSSSSPANKAKSGVATSSAAAVDVSKPDASGVFGTGGHIHDSLPFLHAQRRDINGNTPDSQDFDPRTIKIPADFLKKETPAMAQWWEVKSRNMDTVLFFKVGKFYELFHMDADIGFKELNLIYMKGEKAHSGFPEIAYGKFSSQLVAKGYRVARVEQTETPDMMKERNARTASKSKVVRREVCSLLSLGTNTLSFLDAPISSASQKTTVSSYLLALKERTIAAAPPAVGENGSSAHVAYAVRYGVCLVDCATGAFHLAEFDDTEQRDRLKTLLAQFNVVEAINERNGLSSETKQVIKFATPPSVVRSELIVGKEFWDANRTIEEVVRAGYFNTNGWPEDVACFLHMDKTVRDDGQLAISAFGGCVWHLRRSIIDQELVSLCNFTKYKPSDEANANGSENTKEQSVTTDTGMIELSQQYVVLDSQTIQNLEILTNNYNGSRKGSLIDIMDKTMTSFGKRMFQEWVLKPLCKTTEINERLDAVEELGQNVDAVEEVRHFLTKLPDLERLLSRIHALGSTHRSQEHPDSRAVMYESNTYNIRKIRDFLTVLNGFDTAMDLVEQLGPRFAQFKSPLLKTILKKHDHQNVAQKENGGGSWHGHFPELREKLQFFKNSFDQAKAAKSGVILPQEGADPDYDDACDTIAGVQQELEEYLQEQRKRLKASKQVNYWGTKKDERYQLEVPESCLVSGQPKDYELKSRKKGFKRFHTATIKDLLAQLTAAETRKEIALKDQVRRIFHKFDDDYKYWMKAVQCLAVLDCLMGLAIVSSQSEGFVRPQVISAASENNGAPFIEIEQGVHPCVAATFDSGDFIPNDTQLGVDGKGQMIVLSGPNMGGKSTLLRQTCVLALMAQVGCFVPATKLRMSPVDRIFTRIGASDRILAGQSTLYVELAETATILNHATQHSLVILDELGRGTSTFDGTAIAYAVVEYLLRDVGCRSLFATHYHSLVEEYVHEDKVSLGHMGCFVDPENDRKVTFLYKLEDGMCPKSYGLNVAMLAKLPDEVIELAGKKSDQFEKSLQANSHSELEAMKLTEKIQECLSAESGSSVDLEELQALWREAQRHLHA